MYGRNCCWYAKDIEINDFIIPFESPEVLDAPHLRTEYSSKLSKIKTARNREKQIKSAR